MTTTATSVGLGLRVAPIFPILQPNSVSFPGRGNKYPTNAVLLNLGLDPCAEAIGVAE
jgi:hypothetical protein